MAASSAAGPYRGDELPGLVELEDWQVLYWDCFDMYMYMYMHMLGLREPMVLSALKCVGLAGPMMPSAKSVAQATCRQLPKVPLFGSVLKSPYSKDLTDWFGRKAFRSVSSAV
jgi:hypothetical protein